MREMINITKENIVLLSLTTEDNKGEGCFKEIRRNENIYENLFKL
jgi:hypothetical protein